MSKNEKIRKVVSINQIAPTHFNGPAYLIDPSKAFPKNIWNMFKEVLSMPDQDANLHDLDGAFFAVTVDEIDYPFFYCQTYHGKGFYSIDGLDNPIKLRTYTDGFTLLPFPLLNVIQARKKNVESQGTRVHLNGMPYAYQGDFSCPLSHGRLIVNTRYFDINNIEIDDSEWD